MSINSRDKGAAGEREWAEFCREFFSIDDSRRTAQRMGAPDSNDVITFPGTHCEVKRVEKLNVEAAMQQAEADSGYRRQPGIDQAPVPYVAHRRNRTEWLVTVRAADLLEFCERVLRREAAKEEHPLRTTPHPVDLLDASQETIHIESGLRQRAVRCCEKHRSEAGQMRTTMILCPKCLDKRCSRAQDCGKPCDKAKEGS